MCGCGKSTTTRLLLGHADADHITPQAEVRHRRRRPLQAEPQPMTSPDGGLALRDALACSNATPKFLSPPPPPPRCIAPYGHSPAPDVSLPPNTPRRNGASYREGARQLRGAGRWVNTGAKHSTTLAKQPQLPLLTSSSTSSLRRPRLKSNSRVSTSMATPTTTSTTWSTTRTIQRPDRNRATAHPSSNT
jgi:hypothetical protein